MMERKARQKGWSRTPRNRWLSTCVTNLMTNPKGMIEEMGNIPDEPIPEIGDKLTIDDRHFTVVDVYLHDGRECDSAKDTREVYVVEDGYKVPRWWKVRAYKWR